MCTHGVCLKKNCRLLSNCTLVYNIHMYCVRCAAGSVLRTTIDSKTRVKYNIIITIPIYTYICRYILSERAAVSQIHVDANNNNDKILAMVCAPGRETYRAIPILYTRTVATTRRESHPRGDHVMRRLVAIARAGMKCV